MPHIIIEHSEELSSQIELPGLAKDLHVSLAGQDTVVRKDIKTRTIAVQNSYVGEAEDTNLFIHVVLKLLEGRDQSLRCKMASDLHSILKDYTSDIICSISVDTVEMNKVTYIK